jgi:hypothetical protein
MTGFYSNHLLKEKTGEKDRYGRDVGFFELPDINELKKKVKQKYKNWYLCYFDKENSPSTFVSKLQYHFNYHEINKQVTISICGNTSESYSSPTFASITLSTVNYNCGAVQISNLISEIGGCGIGKFLLEQVLKFLEEAGYSFVLMNTAGGYQNKLGKAFFEKKFGFIPMKDFCYVNQRSGNVNVWYCKYLPNTRVVSYTEDFSTPDEEGYEDEDF